MLLPGSWTQAVPPAGSGLLFFAVSLPLIPPGPLGCYQKTPQPGRRAPQTLLLAPEGWGSEIKVSSGLAFGGALFLAADGPRLATSAGGLSSARVWRGETGLLLSSSPQKGTTPLRGFRPHEPTPLSSPPGGPAS